MYQYQDQKEMRRALNGKMIVMLVGIMLVMTALTSSLSYGMRCWSMAGMADKGNEEVLEALNQIDITSGTLRACSVVYYIQAVIETMVGIFCCTFVENEPGNSGSRSSGGCCTDSNAYDQSVYDHFQSAVTVVSALGG